ncbi:NAD(P)/FAD-dependent oxidoreductase [Nocardioides sp. TRM66260-LWL]|nr:NAD(P)/FAD-dependent oxidoreductase [Nocardioides sp. TRM66260-LWL]
MDGEPRRRHYDVVVVGGGHNGLVSAAYLARAGLSVLVLERLGRTGGAAVSEQAFAGHDVRLSRYSYLVSLLPERIADELDLDLRLVSRRTASYAPTVRDGVDTGLLVERPEGRATRDSFRAVTRRDEEYEAWCAFYGGIEHLARVVEPTLTEPLPREGVLREAVEAQAPGIWGDLVERPLGEAIERRFADDTVRGVVATDALIGTFASLHDPSLVQNRCFLYHLIGRGTGEWRVPVGGMGAVSGALESAAARAGAEILTGAGVHRIHPGSGPGSASEVVWDDAAGRRSVTAGHVLSGVAPWVLRILLGGAAEPTAKPVGAQLKINMLLDRLPRLRSGLDPRTAFAGTLHLCEGYDELAEAHRAASAGRLPDPLPGEVYCHSLTDPSILGENDADRHTLTWFGLHTPAWLFEGDHDAARDRARDAALASLDRHLIDPIADCLARDADGRPCVEVRTPQDLEAELALPGGHIFHGDLDWPWARGRARLDDPADAWGVATGVPGVLLCGSGAKRGGAVSGLGGHNAAQAVLAERG